MENISNMSNIMISSPIAIGEFIRLLHHEDSEFIQNENIDEGTLLASISVSLDLDVHQVSKCRGNLHKKKEKAKVTSNFAIDYNDDKKLGSEIEIGPRELLKIFNKKSVNCLEQPSVYVFRQSILDGYVIVVIVAWVWQRKVLFVEHIFFENKKFLVVAFDKIFIYNWLFFLYFKEKVILIRKK